MEIRKAFCVCIMIENDGASLNTLIPHFYLTVSSLQKHILMHFHKKSNIKHVHVNSLLL